MLREAGDDLQPAAVAVAFVSCFLFFLQLRIADEFKDIEEDRAHRPYRPVPRGLVSLRELGWVFVGAAAIQLALALWLMPPMVGLLAVVWIYLAAMSKEFFLRSWIENKPVTYLWTHMLIMPLIDLYATTCDWMMAGAQPPPALGWFLVASFFNGMVIEIGRKIRSPVDEEGGVKTYTVLWGRPAAVGAWWAMMVLTAVFALGGALAIERPEPVAVGMGLVGTAGLIVGWRFLKNPGPGDGKKFEGVSFFWTLALYLGLGAIPLAWKWMA
ncbi:MAG: UbiA family prenyltransferase [Phycisphaeraceae bacterium]|nr:UbiA family prenyltransferase [Phycisphaeraceae bacterium]